MDLISFNCVAWRLFWIPMALSFIVVLSIVIHL